MARRISTKKLVSINLVVLIFTYIAALLILKFGNMNPFVVAFMPCLALSFSGLLKK